jgi:hypothetical protein
MQGPPVNGKQGPAFLNNKKQDSYDQIYADNRVTRSEVRINRKICKKKILKEERLKVINVPRSDKYTHACQQKTNPFCDIVPSTIL